MYYILFTFFTILFFIFLYLYGNTLLQIYQPSITSFTNSQPFNFHINFLNSYQTKNFILEDSDFYINSLSISDLSARNINYGTIWLSGESKLSNSNYLLKCSQNTTDILHQNKIILCCNIADQWFSQLSSKYLNKYHDIHNIKWNIASTKGYYENGFPHTRSNIIFITPEIENRHIIDLTSLLIHEKLHIYQRYNRASITENLEYCGYYKKNHRFQEKLLRSNPDIDEFIYTNPKGEKMYYKYNSILPKNIIDGTIFGDFEHPYEMISYELENDFINQYNKDKDTKFSVK
jgi:hypothetical protein